MGAMVEVVAERGYPETRVVDIIEAARVSRKTFYELFSDKETCFLAAYDEALGALYRGTSAAFSSAPKAAWAERIRNALAAFLGMMAARPATAKFCVVDVLAAGPRALARRDAAVRQFAGFIETGRAESALELPAATALSLAGGINELLYSEIIHGAGVQLPARLPEIIFWVTQPFLGSDAAQAERRRASELMDRQGAPPMPGDASRPSATGREP
jgi:AcrR family transcriptional regulator